MLFSLITAFTIGTAIVGNMPIVVISAFELALSRFGTPLLLRPDCRKTSRPLIVELSILMALVTLAVVFASTPAPPPAYEATSRLPLGWRRDSARVASSRSPVLFSSVAPVTLIFALAVESIRDTPTATPNPETLSMRTLSYASASVKDSMRNTPGFCRLPWAVRRAVEPMSTIDWKGFARVPMSVSLVSTVTLPRLADPERRLLASLYSSLRNVFPALIRMLVASTAAPAPMRTSALLVNSFLTPAPLPAASAME